MFQPQIIPVAVSDFPFSPYTIRVRRSDASAAFELLVSDWAAPDSTEGIRKIKPDKGLIKTTYQLGNASTVTFKVTGYRFCPDTVIFDFQRISGDVFQALVKFLGARLLLLRHEIHLLDLPDTYSTEEDIQKIEKITNRFDLPKLSF